MELFELLSKTVLHTLHSHTSSRASFKYCRGKIYFSFAIFFSKKYFSNSLYVCCFLKKYFLNDVFISQNALFANSA